MCHSFRRGTMQMYQIREANSGGKSKKVWFTSFKKTKQLYTNNI